ncbi:NADH:flavin oxidoreductase [Flavobacterium sp. DG1-102-2]|uniref:NADH:flavin oxidoreductase n=1 Tax=Flavobacterium sp. DG1-102-2 TaxID=3081663 RepID=UPI0029490CE6|nr:NADH:flavin oxidoreductase [Flavobacterium sp. DG1-102-2]MDV6169375.1 NADH:flavin oxidoreductase [Flavobacterium sp. DG1-102-2]
MNFDALFQPFQYKGLNLKNRFVMAPMTRTFSPDGVPTQFVADYYARRAAAEVGLIITEGTVINRPSAKNQKDIPDFYGDAALNAWGKVVQDVHAAHGKIAPQLWHVGNTPYGWEAPAPFESPDAMTLKDIEDTIKAFADAARNAKALGFDAFEIHGAHGYLIDQFFWEVTNNRTDEYGGKTIKERSRFAVDVVKAMREAVGPDMVIILRVSQWKQQDYGVKLASDPSEMEDWLQPLVEAGIDIFHASQRRYWESEFDGSDLNFAGWIKKVTGQPTITVGSVGLSTDVMELFTKGGGSETAEMSEMLRRFERGDFDLVAIGRALLQDPEWVQKVKMKRFDELKAFDTASLQQLY